jgi:uncharacterized protein YdaU (DUF1376 family)
VKKFKVRKYNHEFDTITVVELTIDEMMSDPYSLNMADVGTYLLNERRAWNGLEPIPDNSVADNVEEFMKRELNEH